MPGRGNGGGRGNKHDGGGGTRGGQGGQRGAERGGDAGSNDPFGGEHGRSAASPGHLKKEAGAQSARDFAPGHAPGAGDDSTPADKPAGADPYLERDIEELRRG